MATSLTLDVSSATAPLAVGPSPETARPAADEALYEVVNGQRLELPPRGAYSTWIACELQGYMWTFARERSLGKAVTEMLFILDREANLRRRPDVAFVSAERWPPDRPMPLTGDWDVVPDLAVEVVSSHDTASELLTKIGDYFTHGVRRVWVIYPEERQAYIYETPTQIRVLTENGELDGADVLPGFRIPLSKILQPRAATTGAEDEQPTAQAESQSAAGR